MSWKIGYVPRSKEVMERPGTKRQRLYNGTGKRSKLRRRKQRVQRLEFQKRSLSICFCLFVFSLISFFPFLKIKIYIYILWREIRMPGAEWTETRGSLWHHTRDHLANLDRTLWWWRVLHVCVEVQMPSVHSILAVKVDAVRNYREFVIFFQR